LRSLRTGDPFFTFERLLVARFILADVPDQTWRASIVPPSGWWRTRIALHRKGLGPHRSKHASNHAWVLHHVHHFLQSTRSKATHSSLRQLAHIREDGAKIVCSRLSDSAEVLSIDCTTLILWLVVVPSRGTEGIPDSGQTRITEPNETGRPRTCSWHAPFCRFSRVFLPGKTLGNLILGCYERGHHGPPSITANALNHNPYFE
jgi:hypothetical protein